MKKVKPLLLLFAVFYMPCLSAQNSDNTGCTSIDFHKYISVSELQYPDSNTWCLDLNGAASSKVLADFFMNYPYKEKITIINLNGYSGTVVPSSIKVFSRLKTFSVTDCPALNFKRLFQCLAGMSSVTELILDDNESANIPSNIKTLNSLTSITITDYDFIDGNRLMKNISQISSLQNLTLSSIIRLELDTDAALPENIQQLNLSDNWLPDLPDMINNLKKLRILDVSDNNFGDIDQLIRKIDSLPLNELSITCFKKTDSVKLSKRLNKVTLKVALYREPEPVFSDKKSAEPRVLPAAITKFYNNRIIPVARNTSSITKIYTVDPQQERKLYFNSGTTIDIPANAFVDSLGRPVTGNIDVYYREYYDVVDIVTGGVPMTYDSAGQRNFFRTAGMFEIYALRNNEMLKLEQGKKISLDLATIDTSAGFNLYRLNQQTGNWDFTEPLQNKVSVKKRVYSMAYKNCMNLFKYDFDTTRFAERYNDSTYSRVYKIAPGYFQGKKLLLRNYFRIKRLYGYIKDKELGKLPYFIMNFKHYNSCPEFSVYRNYIWVYSGSLSKKEFSKKFIYRKKWTDMRITYDKPANVFNIEFKSPHEVVEMQAMPVKSNYTMDTKKYIPLYSRLDKKYSSSLRKVEARFDKFIVRKMARSQKFQWSRIRSGMSPEEKLMSKEEWLDYARKMSEAEKNNLDDFSAGYETITRSLSIDGFGIWNCDQILRLKNPVNVLAHFKNQYDQNMKIATVNVIDSGIKGVLSYYYKNGLTKIAFDPYSETAIFLICNDGSIGLIDKETVKNTWAGNADKTDFTFKAYETNADDMTTSEIRKMLGL